MLSILKETDTIPDNSIYIYIPEECDLFPHDPRPELKQAYKTDDKICDMAWCMWRMFNIISLLMDYKILIIIG